MGNAEGLRLEGGILGEAPKTSRETVLENSEVFGTYSYNKHKRSLDLTRKVSLPQFLILSRSYLSLKKKKITSMLKGEKTCGLERQQKHQMMSSLRSDTDFGILYSDCD